MLPKHQKLTGKDINYMLKRGKRVYGKLFTFWVIPQYAQRKFNQRGIQVPLKVEKRATMRNMLKRAGYLKVGEFSFKTKSFYKVFIVVNKKNSKDLVEHIATKNKTAILQEWSELLEKDLNFLKSRLS